ncbi:MAG: DNA-binding protein [Candidatus Ratteibacteria bacterium]
MKPATIVFVIVLIMTAFCRGQSIPALVNNPDLFDGKIVSVDGELVGDIIEGKGGFWVNVLEADVAIGVWCPLAARGKIKFLGRYDVEGDIVRVEGVFHKRCVEHTGDMDIHAGSIEVLKQGRIKEEEIPIEKVIFAFSLGIVSLAAIGLLHILTRRESLHGD